MSGSTGIAGSKSNKILATRVVRILGQDVARSACRAGAQDGEK